MGMQTFALCPRKHKGIAPISGEMVMQCNQVWMSKMFINSNRFFYTLNCLLNIPLIVKRLSTCIFDKPLLVPSATPKLTFPESCWSKTAKISPSSESQSNSCASFNEMLLLPSVCMTIDRSPSLAFSDLSITHLSGLPNAICQCKCLESW